VFGNVLCDGTCRDTDPGGNNTLDSIITGTESVDTSGIDQLVSAMAQFGQPSGGGITLNSQEQQTVNSAIAVAWQ